MEELTKEEVLHRLKTSGELKSMDDSQNWRDAFDLYYKATGVRLRVKDFCIKCFTAVSMWLQGIE